MCVCVLVCNISYAVDGDGDDGTTAVTAVMGLNLNFITATAVIAGIATHPW